MNKFVSASVLLLPLLGANALDLEIDHVQCDTSLPAYAEADAITMKCDGNTRCTLGEDAMISGERKLLTHETRRLIPARHLTPLFINSSSICWFE